MPKKFKLKEMLDIIHDPEFSPGKAIGTKKELNGHDAKLIAFRNEVLALEAESISPLDEAFTQAATDSLMKYFPE